MATACHSGALGGSGYVTDLGKAQLFTQDGALDHSDTDIPWPKDYIEARARIGVDCQYVEIREALDQYPEAAESYMQKPKAWNGSNLIWLKAGGGFTSNLSKAVRVARADTINMIGSCGQTGGIAWPCAYIDAHSRRLVQPDDVDIKEALRGTSIVPPKQQKPRDRKSVV